MMHTSMKTPSKRPPRPRTDGGWVLVVDDNDDARDMVMFALNQERIRTVGAASGEEALAHLKASPASVDAIVLDVRMPGMDGFEVVNRLKRSQATANIPVIMVTASENRDTDIIRGISRGALDYIMKPCSPAVLVAKVQAACKRSRDEKALRRDLRHASLHATLDPLTGLFNRRHFETRIVEVAAHAKRNQEAFAVVMLDLDHFKTVNDTYGHEEGDRVLRDFADALRSVLRAEDVAYRYGGEEFVLVLRGCDANRAVDVANRLRKQLHASPFQLHDGSARVTAFSAGTASAQASEGFSGDKLVSRADAALYRAKANGRDRVERW